MRMYPNDLLSMKPKMRTQTLTTDVVEQIAKECGLDISQSLTLPSRRAVYAPLPNRLHSSVLDRLSIDYPSGLYRHQALALESFLDGEDVALSTSTASGKSLVFIAAALDTLAKNPDSRILAVYPTKSLIRDQMGKWETTLRGTSAGVALIDGTVNNDLRGGILESNQVILMTPDVLHAWLMANLQEKRITAFRNALRLLILDEAHVYEGAFGTNMAYLMRRLDAASLGFRVLCSTATLGSSSDFLYKLTGRRIASIGQDRDGSPAPERRILASQDPGFDRLVELLRKLATVDGGRFLAFSDSRKMVEKIVAATMRVGDDRNEPGSDEEQDLEARNPKPTGATDLQRILPFRAGYETEDAGHIQDELYRGRLGGVVSTSAMELGLDIGEIDLVVMLGLPPSVKAFHQRLGRAGRQRDGVCLVIDTKGAITNTGRGIRSYLAKPLEPSWLYLENKYLMYANVLCAAAECTDLNLSADRPQFQTLPPDFKRLLENELNPVETLPADFYSLKQRAQTGPHREFPLRSGIEKNFRISTPQGYIGNVSHSQMLREAYPGAIYYYMGQPYRITRVHPRDGQLSAIKWKSWATKPLANAMVFPRFGEAMIGLSGKPDAFVVHGELQVSEKVSGFQELRGRNRESHHYGPNSEWHRRDLNRFFETTGVCWFTADRALISEDVAAQIKRAFCLNYGIQERDIGIGPFHSQRDPFGSAQKCQGICIYDAVTGGLRLTQRLAENFVDVVQSAANYAEADELNDIAEQLRSLAAICGQMRTVSLLDGGVETIAAPENWVEVIKGGEPSIYLSEDGSREVMVLGYRFTPSGLMYELKPESDKGSAKWMASNRVIQPLYGITRMTWVDFMTGEEQDHPPIVVSQ